MNLPWCLQDRTPTKGQIMRHWRGAGKRDWGRISAGKEGSWADHAQAASGARGIAFFTSLERKRALTPALSPWERASQAPAQSLGKPLRWAAAR